MTKIDVRMVNLCVAVATLTDSDDGGRAFVMCSIPAGRPMFSFTDPGIAGTITTSVVNAPMCLTIREFRAFVIERFGS